MPRKKKVKVQLSPLNKLYDELKDVMETESEAIRRDITSLVWEELVNKIENGEIINWAVRGEVATGKSTVAAKIMWEGNKYLIKIEVFGKDTSGLHETPIEKQTTRKITDIDFINYIMSDQTEFLRFTNKGERNTFIQIDEYNRLAEGGINATSESTLYDYYSDVFAQKGIHRTSCAPSIVNDRNATVILDVIGKNTAEKITRCKVTYRDPVDGTTRVLGKANIYVGDIIKTEWYKKYRIKKFKRMELLDKHGVRDIRELEFAGHVLQTYTELLPLARTGDVDMGVINATVKKVVRKQKMIYSLYALSEMKREWVGGLLEGDRMLICTDKECGYYGIPRYDMEKKK